MSEQPHEMIQRLERMGQQKQPHTRHMAPPEKYTGLNPRHLCPVCDDRPCYCQDDEATRRRWKIYYEGLDWRIEE